MKLTHEDIIEKVEIWLDANKGRAADGFYLTDDKKYVVDAYGPMGPGRYMPVEDPTKHPNPQKKSGRMAAFLF